MQNKVETLIRQSLQVEALEVEMAGNHCSITVVSTEFEGLGPVKRQQKIYQCLNEQIASGEIHAVNIKALTPEQWQAAAGTS